MSYEDLDLVASKAQEASQITSTPSEIMRKRSYPSRKPSIGSHEIRTYLRNGPDIYGESNGAADTAYGEGEAPLRLEGRTDASFSSSFRTSGVRMKDAEGCSCSEDKCVRASGVLTASYNAQTKVTLPKVSDYPELSASQKRNFQKAIVTILAPHERQHVAAFKKYNGTTSRRFDLTLCRSEVDSTIQSMFEEEEDIRRSAAKAESDALDPFYFDFEL